MCHVILLLDGNGLTASLLYVINVLRVKLVVVMGHRGCGAIEAALAVPSENTPLQPVPTGISEGVDTSALSGLLCLVRRCCRGQGGDPEVHVVNAQVSRLLECVEVRCLGSPMLGTTIPSQLDSVSVVMLEPVDAALPSTAGVARKRNDLVVPPAN